MAEAIAPDNMKAPQGLRVETRKMGNEVLTRIICETNLQTFIATIDDLLESISVAENTFRVAKKYRES